ncbi:hypothetical protein CK203_008100 [Vitis vinifera]|uniref:Uncharacterized protein n=1 Tax=Vitis vinifera TaxID=29760 RepID=A0A438KNJ9_VITVI|nr:hypothetical protein CK203_008100 [Vitis vinifera]
MEARATEEASRAHVREDAGVACCHGGDWRVSEAFPTKARVLITDEALTAESSRGPSGLDETVEGVGFQVPLCAVLNDGSSKWDESSLVKFNKSLGFSIESVEGEILKSLLRLKTRKDQGNKKGTLGLTRGGAKPRGGEIFGVGSFECQGFPNERRRGGRMSSSMRRFSKVIDDLDLRDLPLHGGPFTRVEG